MKLNPLNLKDFYKSGHVFQYPIGTELVYANFTARKSRIDIDYTVMFGLQYLVKEYLIKLWNENFFNLPKEEVINKYKLRMDNALGIDVITCNHIAYLHDLGYLPIKIKAVKEGIKVPIGLPSLTIYNTDPKCFWLTNYLETLISVVLWKSCTNAAIAHKYRKTFEKFAETTSDMKDFVKFQGHDFSFRGMSSVEDAIVCGAAHLLSFVGTDTIPAIDFLEEYYGANSDKELVGCSVPATEHSVQSLGGIANNETNLIDGEYQVYKRLINEIYPKGIVSIVSDTWDFWQVINDFLPRLKDDIMARDGTVVIRPDSGDPVKIVCGDSEAQTEWERKGAIDRLYEVFGGTINSKGFKQLDNHISLIYGDSITLERQYEILNRLKEKGFASTNMVFGIGSFTYQYNTRDSVGWAMKAVYGEVNGKGYNIFKSPKTDTGGMKKSHKGLLRLDKTETGEYNLTQECTWEQESGGLLETVFENGQLVREQSLNEIRELLKGQ